MSGSWIYSRLYGLSIGLGILAGAWLVAKLVKREKMEISIVWDGLVWVVVGGILGARIYHVIDLWGYYGQNWGQILAVWNGGLGIYGALIGGMVGLGIFLRKRGVVRADVVRYVDLGSLGIPVGQAIGRWGNFFNQELYGRPTQMPWGVYIEPGNRVGGYEQFGRFEPLFLYESILNLILAGVMLAMYRKYGKRMVGQGKMLGVYLMGYGLIRMVLEPMRIEKWEALGVPMAVWVSGVAVLIGGILVVGIKKSSGKK